MRRVAYSSAVTSWTIHKQDSEFIRPSESIGRVKLSAVVKALLKVRVKKEGVPGSPRIEAGRGGRAIPALPTSVCHTSVHRAVSRDHAEFSGSVRFSREKW